MPALNYPWSFARFTRIQPTDDPITALIRMQREIDDFMTKLEDGLNARMFSVGMSLSVNQSINSASYTKILFDRSLYETHSGFISLSGGDIVAPIAGVYRIEAHGWFASNATGGRSLEFYKNGSAFVPAVVDQVGTAAAGVEDSLFPQDTRSLGIGDRISAVAWQNSGGPLNFLATNASLTLTLVAT